MNCYDVNFIVTYCLIETLVISDYGALLGNWKDAGRDYAIKSNQVHVACFLSLYGGKYIIIKTYFILTISFNTSYYL